MIIISFIFGALALILLVGIIFIPWGAWPTLTLADGSPRPCSLGAKKTYRLAPVDSVPAPPELSCFVKGIIRSMRETPDEWLLGSDWCQHYPDGHTKDGNRTDLRLVRYWHDGDGIYYWTVVGDSISHDEGAAIADQGISYLQSLINQKADAARAAARAQWERLGCPTTHSTMAGGE